MIEKMLWTSPLNAVNEREKTWKQRVRHKTTKATQKHKSIMSSPSFGSDENAGSTQSDTHSKSGVVGMLIAMLQCVGFFEIIRSAGTDTLRANSAFVPEPALEVMTRDLRCFL